MRLYTFIPDIFTVNISGLDVHDIALYVELLFVCLELHGLRHFLMFFSVHGRSIGQVTMVMS